MNWPILVENIRSWLSGGELKTFVPATAEEIIDAENKLAVKFPRELVEYLSYSNGIQEFMKHPQTGEPMLIDDLIWSVDKIVSMTVMHYDYLASIGVQRTDNYIFFADNGCGESFCYKVNENLDDPSIYIYYPIDNKHKRIASNLEEWVNGWFSGNIST